MIDGIDSNGNPTGKKCRVCRHQFEKCEHQDFYCDGAFLICSYDLENIEHCKLEKL